MSTSFVFVVAWVLSIAFTGLVSAGLIVYIRRTLQLLRAEEDGSVHERILDSVDQVQSQLYSISSRLDRLEHRIEGPSPDPDRHSSPNDV